MNTKDNKKYIEPKKYKFIEDYQGNDVGILYAIFFKSNGDN